jgi:hypothetical protein
MKAKKPVKAKPSKIVKVKTSKIVRAKAKPSSAVPKVKVKSVSKNRRKR